MTLVLDDLIELNTTILKENVIKYDNIQKNEAKSVVLIKKSCYTCVYLYGLYLNYPEKHIQQVLKSWSDDNIYSKFEEKAIEFKKNITGNNISLIVLIIPYNQQFSSNLNYSRYPQERLGSLFSGMNVTVIDIIPYLDDDNYKDYYMINDKIHLNSKGFDKIEPIVFEELKKKLILYKN